MDLTVLGSSGSCAVPGNPGSGYLVSHEATNIWCDAGPGTFMALMAHVDPGLIDAVVLSHVHPDHCADLLAFFGYLAHGPGGPVPIPVYLPDGVVEPIAAFLGAGPRHALFRTFDFRLVDVSDVAVVGDVELRFAVAHHPVPTLAVRFSAGGRSLAYSADTGPGGGFPELASGADVVLVEATLTGRRHPDSYQYHLYAEEAGALAARSGARLIVTHLSPTVDPATVMSAADILAIQ